MIVKAVNKIGQKKETGSTCWFTGMDEYIQ